MAATTPTIKIADDALHPVRTEASHRPGSRGNSTLAGGVYHTRNRSRLSLRPTPSRTTHDHRTDAASIGGGEEGDEWQNDNVKTKQVFRGTTLLW